MVNHATPNVNRLFQSLPSHQNQHTCIVSTQQCFNDAAPALRQRRYIRQIRHSINLTYTKRPDVVPCDRGDMSRNIENLGLVQVHADLASSEARAAGQLRLSFRQREQIIRIWIKISRIISSCFSSRSKSVEEERRLLPNTELGLSECERRAYELGPCFSSSNLGLATYLSPPPLVLQNLVHLLMLQLSLSFWWFLALFASYNSTDWLEKPRIFAHSTSLYSTCHVSHLLVPVPVPSSTLSSTSPSAVLRDTTYPASAFSPNSTSPSNYDILQPLR